MKGVSRSRLARFIDESRRSIRMALTRSADEVVTEDVPWYEKETTMKKYRKYRSTRNKMARASRKANRAA